MLKNQRDRLSALEAICAYALDNEERPKTDAADAMFTIIQPILDAAEKKSQGGKNSARLLEDNGKMSARYEQDTDNKSKNKNKVEKKSLDLFSTENKSVALAESRPEGGPAARRYGTYDPEDDKREIVYKEFDVG